MIDDTPTAQAAERALVGSLLCEPHRAPEARSIVQPEHIHQGPIREVVALIYELARSTPSLDAVVIEEHALRRGLHAARSGELHQWLRDAPPTAAIEGYCREVLRASVARRGRDAALEAARSYSEGKDPSEVARRLRDTLRGIEEASSTGAHGIGSVGPEELERLRAIRDGTATAGIPWGLGPVDETLGPLMSDDFVILAGRPGMGKSAIGQQMCEALADEGHPTLYCAMEMTRATMWQRAMARKTGIGLTKIRFGDLEPHELRMLEKWADWLDLLPMTVLIRPVLTVDAIRAAALECGAQLVVVDYIQRISTPGLSRGASEYDQVTRASTDLAALRAELEVPIVALAQLNRQVEHRQDKRPQIADLRGSGNIEQDARLIAMLYRDSYYNPAGDDAVEIDVVKNSNGPQPSCKLPWHGPTASVITEGVDPLDTIVAR